MMTREKDREVPLEAVLSIACPVTHRVIRPHMNVAVFAGAMVDARQVTAVRTTVDDLRILWIGGQEAAFAAGRIIDAVALKPIETGQGPLVPMVSVGAVVVPTHAATIRAAVETAGGALDYARRNGPGHFAVHSPDYDTVATRMTDMRIADDLVYAINERRLVVDAFARWRITDVVLFRQAVQNEINALSRLDSILKASLREVLGTVTSADVLSPERTVLMARIRDASRTSATALGVEIIDVRIRRADLPEQNLNATFARMNAEREREASGGGRDGFKMVFADDEITAMDLLTTPRERPPSEDD